MPASDLLLSCLIAVACTLTPVKGHGYMSLPAQRGSLWRFPQYPTALPDYDDNGLTAGGPKVVVINENLRQYGICGDPFSDPQPRPHETGGKYGRGIIAKCYAPGQTIDISVVITAHHKGYFEFQLCKLEPNGREDEACFSTYLINANGGGTTYELPNEGNKEYHMQFQLPSNVVCDGDTHCVLRWHHMTGNSPGSILKEEYWNCADIQIGNCNSGSTSTPIITPVASQETTSPTQSPVGPATLSPTQNPISITTPTPPVVITTPAPNVPPVSQNCGCNAGFGCVNGACNNCLYSSGALQACYSGWSSSVCKSLGASYRWCGAGGGGGGNIVSQSPEHNSTRTRDAS